MAIVLVDIEEYWRNLVVDIFVFGLVAVLITRSLCSAEALFHVTKYWKKLLVKHHYLRTSFIPEFVTFVVRLAFFTYLTAALVESIDENWDSGNWAVQWTHWCVLVFMLYLLFAYVLHLIHLIRTACVNASRVDVLDVPDRDGERPGWVYAFTHLLWEISFPAALSIPLVYFLALYRQFDPRPELEWYDWTLYAVTPALAVLESFVHVLPITLHHIPFALCLPLVYDLYSYFWNIHTDGAIWAYDALDVSATSLAPVWRLVGYAGFVALYVMAWAFVRITRLATESGVDDPVADDDLEHQFHRERAHQYKAYDEDRHAKSLRSPASPSGRQRWESPRSPRRY